MSWDLAKHTAPASLLSWVFLALGLGVFTMAGFGWAGHLSAAGEVVAGNVSYAGQVVEGLTRPEVEGLVSQRAEDLLSASLVVEFEGHEVTLTPGEVGFVYDVDATVDQVMSVRYQGSIWDQFSSWAASGVATTPATEVWRFDVDRARDLLQADDRLVPDPMTEPGVVVGLGRLEVTPGEVGHQADTDVLIAALAGVDLTRLPPRLDVPVRYLPPTVAAADVEELAAELERVVRDGVEVSVDGRHAVVPAHKLRTALVFEIGAGTLSARFDGDRVQEAVESVFVGPVGDSVEPTFDIRDEEIVVVSAGEPPPVCCREDVGEWMGRELLAGASGPFGLPTRPADDPTLIAWADGSLIVEKVSEFTTPHRCCEARVANIQRFADLVRGVYLLPGERLSLNEHVGPRTRENGFVAAGAIRQGYMVPEVGGGVSQFATTIFNAGYFAGLDFEEYRSHTIYFSRYPYGREATISNPAPDLVMVNTTYYPILIWTSYTDTSITVSMYSTPHVEVTEIDQRTSRRGACTHVETDRQRVYPDGRVVVDTIVADYRPAEGIDCNGNPIPSPGA